MTPLWEDPNNRDGGRYVVLIHHRPTGPNAPSAFDSGSETDDSGSESGKFSNLKLPPEYLNIILHVISGLLGPETGFCGIVLSVRRFGMMITIWNTDANDKEWIEDVRQRISRLLNIPAETITYQRQTKSIRNNVRNLTRTTGTMSSSSSREDLSIGGAAPSSSSLARNPDELRKNYSENDLSISQHPVSYDKEIPVRRRTFAPDDSSHIESADRKSALNRPGARQPALSSGSRLRKSDPGSNPVLDSADYEAEIRARLCTSFMLVSP